jgi:hypothetical protein
MTDPQPAGPDFERLLGSPYRSIRACKHGQNGRQIPCPPMCPRQDWPPSLFRRRLFGRGWVLRKSSREYVAAHPLAEPQAQP